MNSKTFVILIALATLGTHWEINQQRKISDLQASVELYKGRAIIANDEVHDLLFNLQTANNKSEFLKTQGYVAGVVDEINRSNTKPSERPEYFAIWHNGYDRGTSNQSMMAIYRPLEPVADCEFSNPETVPPKKQD